MSTMKRSLSVTLTLTLAALFAGGCLSGNSPTAPTGSAATDTPLGPGFSGGDRPQAFAAVKLVARGTSKIEGQIEFFDQTSGILAVGVARKMDPQARCVTMLFDEHSLSNGDACASHGGPAPYEIGAWRVASDGTGRLKVLLDPVQLGDFARIGSASVHEVMGTGFSVTELRACGLVELAP